VLPSLLRSLLRSSRSVSMRLPFPSVPAHIRWPAFVIGLLLISITASAYTFYQAQADGGAAIVEDYYKKGKAWDQTARAQKAGQAFDVTVDVQALSGEFRPVEVVVRDADGRAVTDLSGMLHARRPHLTGSVAAVPLVPVDDRPGTYRQLLPVQEPGIWDFVIDGTRADTPVQMTVRLTL